MKWVKMIAVACLPLALTSCFLSPGAFTSNLDLRRDGSFTFVYKGEIIVSAPDDMMPGSGIGNEPWNDSMAYCYGDVPGSSSKSKSNASDAMLTTKEPVIVDAAESGADAAAAGQAAAAAEGRDCTKAEISEQKKDYEDSAAQRADNKKRESAEFATMFGFAPGDDEANKKIAARLMKQPGWKNAQYVGDGAFQIDYAYTGKVGHDFIFPLFENNDVIFPFVTMRPRSDGSVMISAPGLTGGFGKALALRGNMAGLAKGPSASETEKAGNPRTKGSFSITTDGQILTNNTEDGPTGATNSQQSLTWDIDSKATKIPESLIRLK